MGAFKIVAGWWRHQPERFAVAGVPTNHFHKNETTILNAPIKIVLRDFCIILNAEYLPENS